MYFLQLKFYFDSFCDRKYEKDISSIENAIFLGYPQKITAVKKMISSFLSQFGHFM